MRYRLMLLFVFFFVGVLLIIARLFYWQIIRGEYLQNKAKIQQKEGINLKASRGEIFSSDGTWLVSNKENWTLFAEPAKIDRKDSEVANLIAGILIKEQGGDEKKKEVIRINKLISDKKLFWVPIKTRVENDDKENIEKLGLKGIGFELEEARYYPEASSGAHLLGFVGKDIDGNNLGYFGLEGYYEEMLSGKSGYLSRDSDAGGIPIIIGQQKEVKAIKGIDLYTSIDKSIEIIVEENLKKGIEKYGAKAGTAIVMDPSDGKILAMSSFPSYDPNKYFEYGDEFFADPSISQSFEPGSIFKVIVMASALDSKVIDTDTKCDSCSGALKIDKYYIRTWNNEYFPDSTMSDIIVHSDNVGMAFIGRKMGKDIMYDYLNKFGFGEKTGIDLQGESSPKLRNKKDWREIDVATASFGQGIAVTPIQYIRAVGAIANGGYLVNPSVVVKFKGEGWENDNDRKSRNKIISKKAADEVTAMMVEAAKNGESKWTYYKGFKVAGKTGTAQIPIEGHYDQEKTIASFVGFAPYDNPKFIMLVTLKEPSSSPWASETSAPLWYAIAKDLFVYFGMQPS